MERELKNIKQIIEHGDKEKAENKWHFTLQVGGLIVMKLQTMST